MSDSQIDNPEWKQVGNVHTTTIEWCKIVVRMYDVPGFQVTGTFEVWNSCGTILHTGRAYHKQLGPLRERRRWYPPSMHNETEANKDAAIAYVRRLLGYVEVPTMNWEC